VKEVVSGREYGKLSARRPLLDRAIALARRHKAGIVAADLTRLLRAEAFDKANDRMAVPTAEEVRALLTRAKGVLFLATLADPALTPRNSTLWPLGGG
jgi:hypothetical protein